MFTINDGGSAFPPHNMEKGMTMRDWFAGMALNGFLANNAKFADNDNPNEKTFAFVAYKVADAMLKERSGLP